MIKPMSHLNGLKTRTLLRSIESLQSSPWRKGSNVVLITPSSAVVPAEDIQKAQNILKKHNVNEVTTTALRMSEAKKFISFGFQPREELHLLSRPTEGLHQLPSHKIVNGKPWHNKELVKIDRRCFDEFWKFDQQALQVAKAATNIRTTRIVRLDRQTCGYAVSGVMNKTGYLQRLAVTPERSGEGIGTDLVIDSLRWLTRKGAHKAMVNTQLTNHAALSLYDKLGFELEQEGLVVLKWQRSGD